MDSNLAKIKEHHLDEICNNKLGNAIADAEDYLSYILGHNIPQIKKELSGFARHIRHTYLEHKHNKKEN